MNEIIKQYLARLLNKLAIFVDKNEVTFVDKL